MHQLDGRGPSDPTAGPASADPLVGTLLGKDYLVIERIGVGGMGVVYLVEHAALRKRFAAKVLSKELAADAEARARFQTEAHAASQLDHENIISLTDYGLTADGRPYLVMELLRGRTLDQRLAEGPLSLEEIVAVVIPVARALAEAHAEGIVHRDVKPENVFLTARSNGRWGIKVLDFGIAKTAIGGNRLTKTGQALGSPLYMAPEACRGDEIDHRADIYSLGVLMYQLWCGRVPFDDDNLLKVLQMQVSDPVPPPQAARPGLPQEIEAVILRALEKDPDRRFLSIARLLIDLEAALPPDADRLLIEAARGTTSMRAMSERGAATPFPAPTTVGAIALVNESPPVAQAVRPLPTPSTAPVARSAPTPRRRPALWLAGGAVLAAVAVAGWLATRPRPAASTVAPAPAPALTLGPDPAATGGSGAPSVPAAPAPATTVEPAAAAAKAATIGAGATGPGPSAAAAPTVGSAGPAPAVTDPHPARPPRSPRAPKPPPRSAGGPGSGAGSAAGSGSGNAGPDLGIRTNR